MAPRPTPGPVLSQRQLNRALLARQGLLERWDVPVEVALSRLIGVQAQAPQAPFGALWARLADFRPAQLDELLQQRRAVRIALMRSTLFLVTAADGLALRPVLASVGHRAIASTASRRTAAVDLVAVLALSRTLLAARPLTLAELGGQLAAEFPAADASDLALLARAHLPLVQVPPRGLWGRSGPARHQLAHDWLDVPERPADDDPGPVIMRYLTAFGPATAADVQAWSGLTGVRAVLDRLRPALREFLDDRGRTLWDVPTGALPDPETPAPVRILGEFDNVLLSHADRSRIFDDRDRMRFMTQNGLVRATLLVDGRVAGTCVSALEAGPGAGAVTLTVTSHRRLDRAATAAARSEAHRLLALSCPDRVPRIVVQNP